jgi:hypothetical protein
MDKRFTDIIQLIKQSRTDAIRAVNAELINLYWNIGEYISKKIEQSEWGDSIVNELAKYIKNNEPAIKGFSDKNIWRMKQFYETYKEYSKLSTLLREISWSQHAIAANTMCGFFFIASFVPALWGIGIVGSAACVAMGIGCAVIRSVHPMQRAGIKNQ